jgi:protein-S-isoprenylcysteine O-methyltransferase Ste14
MDLFDVIILLSFSVFLLLFIGRTIVLYSRGIQVFTLGRGKGMKENIMEILFLFGFALWMMQLAICAMQLEGGFIPNALTVQIIRVPWLQWAGVFLIIVGLVLFCCALWAFRSSWRIGIDTEHPGMLVTSGVFSKTRNPVFLFIDLYFVGTALIYTSWFFMITALLIMGGMHVQILNEEKFLVGYHGQPYREYMNKVRRYF